MNPSPVHHHHAGGCACCPISRRCFLASSAAALTAPLLAPRRAAAASDLGEYIDLAGFRPQPKLRFAGATVRIKPPYWLGWPGSSYDVEGMQQHFEQECAKSATAVGAKLDMVAAVEDDQALASFIAKLQAEKPDAVLVILEHFAVWHWVDAIAKAGFPTIVFSPIGMAFTGHVLEISRRPGVHVISSLELGAITQAMRMIRAKRQLEQTRLMVVAGDQRSEEVLQPVGVTIKRVPRNLLHELFEQMPENDETHEVAKQMRRGAKDIVEPSKQDIVNAARSYQTAKRLLRDEGCNALTTDCLGMVTERKVPTPPCMAATMFQDAGVTYGCEADINAALGLLTVSYLFDRPGFMNDPVPETVKNLLITAHCTSGTRLNGFDQSPEQYVLRSHSESALGVATQVLWKEHQPVTLLNFQGPGRMIVDKGAVVANVQTPPAGGCRTNFEIAMEDIDDVRDVLGFHQAVFYGDHKRDVEAFCQMWGIQAIHSPEHPPEQVPA